MTLTQLLERSREEIYLALQNRADAKYATSEKTAFDDEDFLRACNKVKALITFITPVSDSLIRKAYLLGLERAKECLPAKQGTW